MKRSIQSGADLSNGASSTLSFLSSLSPNLHSPPPSRFLSFLLLSMPPSRIPLTFPPRTRSRSSTKSSSCSSSSSHNRRLSKTARFPSGYPFSPSSSFPATTTPPTLGGSSSEGSGSRAGSPVGSSVSGGPEGGVYGGSTGDSRRGSSEREKRSQSLGGVANLPLILIS